MYEAKCASHLRISADASCSSISKLCSLGANKDSPDPMNLEIPDEFEIQGVKLATLTQATVYKGILACKRSEPRPMTEKNTRLARTAIKRVTGELETDATIWNSTRKASICPLIQQFLFKTMHGTHLIGKYWRHINGYEDREICATCYETESMSHILMQCKEKSTCLVWHLAKNLWPH